jgi:hypothetical protein
MDVRELKGPGVQVGVSLKIWERCGCCIMMCLNQADAIWADRTCDVGCRMLPHFHWACCCWQEPQGVGSLIACVLISVARSTVW